jgi:uncharacterized protein
MEVKANIKVLLGEKCGVMFNGQDMTLRLLPPELCRACDIEDLDQEQIPAEASLPLEHVQCNLSDLSPGHAAQTAAHERKGDGRPPVHRLSLNVSNMCNMACKYCYANNGVYYTPGMLMDRRTALEAVNFATRNFSVIEHVNFFGGEPTLNQQVIQMVCEYFIYLKAQGILTYLPRFGLTTNGYSISSQMFQVLRRHNFSVSISLDGPKKIHDKLRVGKDDSGTYDAVAENIRAIIGMGIVPEFECTYTGDHRRSGIDLVTLMDFFHENFECRILHCPMVIAEPNSRWFIPLETASELYADAIRYSVRNLLHKVPNSISVAVRLLNSLTTRTPIYAYCPAGKSSITINADGNIYSCFMLMRGTGFCLGNVNGKEHGLGHPDSISALLDHANKWQNPACRDCWAQPLCFGCLGEDIAREGLEVRRSAIPGESRLCDFKRKLTEVFLISVAHASLSESQEEAKSEGKQVGDKSET